MTSSKRWLPGVLGLALLCGGLFACGGGGTDDGGDGGPPEAPFGLSTRPTLAPLNFPDAAPSPRPVDLVRAYPNLSFSRPIFFGAAQAPDGSHWMYVAEQDGRIYAFRNDDGVTTGERYVVLDIRAQVGGPVSRASSEEGLLGLCFDPAYPESGNAHFGEFYVHFSASGPRRSVIARYTATFTGPNGSPVANPNTFESILEVNQPYSNHNAGAIHFGADGYLYIAMGDGGSGGDPHGHGQNLSTLLGSMLRIDPRNPPAGQAYGIPADNPFLAIPSAAPEAYAQGLRNPWRWAFDRNTGDLYLGDVGQGTREEIALVRGGSNQGWDRYEGNFLHEGNEPASNFDPPVIDYPRSQGRIVVGGCVYRGTDVPSLSGAYVYGDHATNRIWALVPDGNGGYTSNTEIQSLNNVVHFGEDESAELYAVSLNGTIHRFREPADAPPPPPAFPTLLSETGLFANLANLTPVTGLIEYAVNSELYSDDAIKRRFIGLPGGSRIRFSPSGPWGFPEGTVLVKHFELLLEVGDPASARRLETRVLINTSSTGWQGYTYRWNDAQTDADLLADAFCESFDIQDPDAGDGVRSQMWRYPSRSQCFACHTQQAGVVLGVRTGQLNRDFAFPEAVDNQLRTWGHIGLFDRPVGEPSTRERWADPADTAQSLEARVRGYLAANCAQCHLENGPVPGNLDFRFTTATDRMHAIDRRPQTGDLGLNDPWIIQSGVKENSVLWLRMGTTSAERMPSLGSLRVHQDAVDLFGAWIDALDD